MSAPISSVAPEAAPAAAPVPVAENADLRGMYQRCRALLTELMKANSPYAHTYKLSQLEATFNHYLTRADAHDEGVRAFTFVYGFLENAILELQLKQKLSQGQTAVSTLVAEIKQLEAGRLLDEGYNERDAQAQAQAGAQAPDGAAVAAASGAPGEARWGKSIESYLSSPLLKPGIASIRVDKPEKREGNFHSYLIFRMLIFTKDGKIIRSARRFNNFKMFNKEVREEVKTNLPKLPEAKHWFFGGRKTDFVAKRIKSLNNYLALCIERREVVQSRAFAKFALHGALWRDASEGY